MHIIFNRFLYKAFVIPFFLILIWGILTFYVSPIILPTPKMVLLSLLDFIFKGIDNFYFDIANTGLVLLLGFLCGAIPGICIGLYAGYYICVGQYFEFSIEFGRSLPSVAMLTPVMMIFGNGILSNITLVALGIFFLSSAAATQIPKSCSTARLNHYKLMGANNRMLWRIILRECRGQLISVIRTSLSVGLILSVVSEMLIGQYYGLGYKLILYRDLFKPEKVWSIVFILGLSGYYINYIFMKLQKRADIWR